MARRTRSVGSRDDHVEFSASRSIFRKYAGESAEGRSHWDLMRGFSGTVAVHQRTYICNAQPGATRCEMIDGFTSGRAAIATKAGTITVMRRGLCGRPPGYSGPEPCLSEARMQFKPYRVANAVLPAGILATGLNNTAEGKI